MGSVLGRFLGRMASRGKVPDVGSELLDAREKLARAEADLSDERRLLDLLLEHTPIYVFFKNEKTQAIRLSRNYEKMLGKPLSEMLGKDMSELFPSALATSMIADDKRILSEGKPVEIVEEFAGRVYSTLKFPILEEGKPSLLAGYTTDITSRVEAERRLETALGDKHALLLELQHRVKNSFALITGLIGLEGGKSGNEGLAGAFEELRSRIMSIAQLYDLLFETGEIRELRLDHYLADVGASIMNSFAFDRDRISFGTELEAVSIDARRAIPIGLIVNELMTNALKYAFPRGTSGQVYLRLSRTGETIEFIVEDDGDGQPKLSAGLDRKPGIGLDLVEMLASQLKAKTLCAMGPDGRGTVYRFAIPAKVPE